MKAKSTHQTYVDKKQEPLAHLGSLKHFSSFEIHGFAGIFRLKCFLRMPW